MGNVSGVRSAISVEELNRRLEPFERSVYSVSREIDSWDPAVITEHLNHVHVGAHNKVLEERTIRAISRIKGLIQLLIKDAGVRTAPCPRPEPVASPPVVPKPVREDELVSEVENIEVGFVANPTPDVEGFADRVEREALEEVSQLLSLSLRGGRSGAG